MPFNAPPTIPQINYLSYPAPNAYAPPLPQPYPKVRQQHARSTYSPCRAPPPSLWDLSTNRRMNDDFVSMKARIHAMLQTGRLPHMPVGFPFHSAPASHYGGHSGYGISHASYDFREQVYLDSKSQPAEVIFAYTEPSRGHPGKHMMTWRILATSRDAMHPREPPSLHTIAQVEVDPGMLETPYGIVLMTEPRIMLQALRTSLEHGLHITIKLADARTPDLYPARKGLRYRPGDLIFIGMSNCGRSETSGYATKLSMTRFYTLVDPLESRYI